MGILSKSGFQNFIGVQISKVGFGSLEARSQAAARSELPALRPRDLATFFDALKSG
jgi:hypothetical protein